MKVLDLFCGGGGSSMGIKRAGNTSATIHSCHITGVDIEYQPEYPGNDLFNCWSFDFIQSDFWHLDPDWLMGFDLIWASPPCQAYSYAGHRWRNAGRKYDDLVNKTRRLLHWSGVPFVIENVVGAPIRKDLTLCAERCLA